MLIPRVRDHVAALIQRIAAGQAAGQALELSQAIHSAVYLTKEIVEMIKLHESYMGRSDAVAQCREAVETLCEHALLAVKVPYVPALVTPILNQLIAYILASVAVPVAEILYDRMVIQPPAPVPAGGAGRPVGSTGSVGASG